MIVSGLDTRRQYTADEVVTLHRSGKLREVTFQGWFFRFDALTGSAKLVHVTDPTANLQDKLRAYQIPDPLPGMKRQVEEESPIRKRTPQERLASMTNKLMRGQQGQDGAALMLLGMLGGAANGNMDGLTEEQVKNITGKSWQQGDPLDADTVRRVAARYLGQAERKVAEDARQTNTRKGRKARREQERLEAQERKAWERRRKALEANNENTKTVF